MSHEATNWTVQQRGISANAKVLLWHLADRHNKDTRECFGLQKNMAEECEFSRSTFNRICLELEEAKLIVSVQRRDPIRNTQLATFYIIAIDFERDLAIEYAVSQNNTRVISHVSNGVVSVSQNGKTPSPAGDTAYKPVNQPSNKPPSRGGALGGEEALAFEKIWKVYPEDRRRGKLGSGPINFLQLV